MDEYLHIKETETVKVKKLTAASVLKSFNLTPVEAEELLLQVFNELGLHTSTCVALTHL